MGVALLAAVLILVVMMKEHPVNAPTGLGREPAREHRRIVNTFTIPSDINPCFYYPAMVYDHKKQS